MIRWHIYSPCLHNKIKILSSSLPRFSRKLPTCQSTAPNQYCCWGSKNSWRFIFYTFIYIFFFQLMIFLQMHVKQFFHGFFLCFYYHRFGFLKSWVACNKILKMATNIFTKWNITTIDKKLKIYKIHILLSLGGVVRSKRLLSNFANCIKLFGHIW